MKIADELITPLARNRLAYEYKALESSITQVIAEREDTRKCLAAAESEIERYRTERDKALISVAAVGRYSLPCSQCRLPVVFEFTVENQTWNRIVRAKNIPEYLCLWCFAALAKDETIVHIGVNISAGSVFSGWCGHDVPGAYSPANDDWEKLKADRDEWKRRAEEAESV